MLHDATFHQSLHCLLKYPFKGFPYTKGKHCIMCLSSNMATIGAC